MLKLDKTDVRILRSLQSRARMTNQQLAASIHLSPSSCLARVRKLEQAGILRGYHAEIDFSQIARMVVCIATVNIKSQTRAESREFHRYIEQVPEIVECYTISGAFDYILKIVAVDMPGYMEITDHLIESIKAEVNITTHVVMEENKRSQAYPIDTLL